MLLDLHFCFDMNLMLRYLIILDLDLYFYMKLMLRHAI